MGFARCTFSWLDWSNFSHPWVELIGASGWAHTYSHRWLFFLSRHRSLTLTPTDSINFLGLNKRWHPCFVKILHLHSKVVVCIRVVRSACLRLNRSLWDSSIRIQLRAATNLMWHASSQINSVHELCFADIFLNRNRVSFNGVDKMICITEHTFVSYIETVLVLLFISLLLLYIHLNIFQVIDMFHPITYLFCLDSFLLLSSIKVEVLDIAVSQSLLMCALFIKWQVRRLNPLLLILFLLLACANLPFFVKFHFL